MYKMPDEFMDSDTKKINEFFSWATPPMEVIKIEPAKPFECTMGRVYDVYLQGRKEAVGLAVGKYGVMIAPKGESAMFSEDERKFMREEVGLALDFDNLTDEDYCTIEREVGYYYAAEVQAHENEKGDTKIMRICCHILDSLA